MIHYGMTKTAQIAVARGLAEASAGTNVTVNGSTCGAEPMLGNQCPYIRN